MKRWAVPAGVAALLLGCAQRPPYAVVTIDDPLELAAAADSLLFGSALDQLSESRSVSTFPTQAVLTRESEGDARLYVEAQRGARAVARASGMIHFDREGSGALSLELARACTSSTACAATYCNGPALCEEGVCKRGPPPCAAATIACFSFGCEESSEVPGTGRCIFRIDPIFDDGNSCTRDICDETSAIHEPLDGTPCEATVTSTITSVTSTLGGSCKDGVCDPG